jgi:hypothetical protein
LVAATTLDVDQEVPKENPNSVVHLSAPKCGDNLSKKVPTTVSIIKTQSRPLGLVTALSFSPRENPDPEFFRSSYDVVSQAITVEYDQLTLHTVGNPAWSEEQKKHYLEGPKDPRYLNLAKEITAGLASWQASDPIMIALKLRRWLEQNVIYTKRADYSGSSDPTAAFLFGSRKGYCVYIAHSMIYLLRAMGIPSRASSGYAPPATRRKGAELLITSKEAHQWPEIYLDGVGWVVMDVAPEQNLDVEEPEPDPELQRLLAEKARKKPEILASQEEKKRRCPVGGWKSLLGLTIPLFLLYVIKVWRRVVPRMASVQSLYRVIYRAALDRLSEAGYSRKFGETREAFAERVGFFVPVFPELTRLHLKHALGYGEPLPRERWLEMDTQVVAAIQRHRPMVRRVLGILNPLSWWWSR